MVVESRYCRCEIRGLFLERIACRCSVRAHLYFSRPTSRSQSTALAPLEGADAASGGGRDSRNLDTPVQFCTSPPVDAHRPKRQANMMAPPPPTNLAFGRSPPSKMFHFQPLEQPHTKCLGELKYYLLTVSTLILHL